MSDQIPGGQHQAPPPGHQPPPPAQAPYGHQPPGQQAPYGHAPYGHQPPGQQAPYGHAPLPPPPSIGQPADLGTRFMARFIDLAIVGVVFGIIYGITLGTFIRTALRDFNSAGSGLAPIVLALLSAALPLGYFVLMETNRGQTVGKMTMKIRTFAPDGTHPDIAQSLKRNGWTALGILGVVPFVGNILGGLLMLIAVSTIAFTINTAPTRQGWHDTFAGGTTVIKVG